MVGGRRAHARTHDVTNPRARLRAAAADVHVDAWMVLAAGVLELKQHQQVQRVKGVLAQVHGLRVHRRGGGGTEGAVDRQAGRQAVQGGARSGCGTDCTW